MNGSVLIVPVAADHPGLAALRAEAARDGFAFLDRLAAEWAAGTARFDRPGECLLGALVGGEFAGIGGLARDPYGPEAAVGRLRHLYVRRSDRRTGIGTALVARLVERARPRFDRLRLRTDTEAAAAFYRARGFGPVEEAGATHALALARTRGPRVDARPARL